MRKLLIINFQMESQEYLNHFCTDEDLKGITVNWACNLETLKFCSINIQNEISTVLARTTRISHSLQLGMDRFHFFKRSFRYENKDEKTKSETIVFKNDRFLLEIVLKKRSFSKRSFSK